MSMVPMVTLRGPSGFHKAPSFCAGQPQQTPRGGQRYGRGILRARSGLGFGSWELDDLAEYVVTGLVFSSRVRSLGMLARRSCAAGKAVL